MTGSVVLKEIHYPRSWNTLDLDEGKFYIHHLIQNTWETKTLPPGQYENNQQVIDAMNKVLSELMVTLELLTTSQIVVFNIPSELELVYSEPLTSTPGAHTPYRILSRSSEIWEISHEPE